MAVPEILIAKFFRVKWGDVGIKDMPFPGGPTEEANVGVRAALEGYFNDPFRDSREKPHAAQLIGQDGRIVATFQMREAVSVGPKAVEI